MTDTETRVSELGSWIREYGCGCRERLKDGEATGAHDECQFHGERVVTVGELTREEQADDLRQRDVLLTAARQVCGGMDDVLDSSFQPTREDSAAWADRLRAAIAEVEGEQ